MQKSNPLSSAASSSIFSFSISSGFSASDASSWPSHSSFHGDFRLGEVIRSAVASSGSGIPLDIVVEMVVVVGSTGSSGSAGAVEDIRRRTEKRRRGFVWGSFMRASPEVVPATSKEEEEGCDKAFPSPGLGSQSRSFHIPALLLLLVLSLCELPVVGRGRLVCSLMVVVLVLRLLFCALLRVERSSPWTPSRSPFAVGWEGLLRDDSRRFLACANLREESESLALLVTLV